MDDLLLEKCNTFLDNRRALRRKYFYIVQKELQILRLSTCLTKEKLTLND